MLIAFCSMLSAWPLVMLRACDWPFVCKQHTHTLCRQHATGHSYARCIMAIYVDSITRGLSMPVAYLGNMSIAYGGDLDMQNA